MYVVRGFGAGCAVILVAFGALAIWPTLFETDLWLAGWAAHAAWFGLPACIVVAGVAAVRPLVRGGVSGWGLLVLGIVAAVAWTALLVLGTDIGGQPVLGPAAWSRNDSSPMGERPTPSTA